MSAAPSRLLAAAALYCLIATSAAHGEPSTADKQTARHAKKAAATAPSPSPGDGRENFVALPFRSAERVRAFADAAILRFVCSREYLAVIDGRQAPCSDAVLGGGTAGDQPSPASSPLNTGTPQPRIEWSFVRGGEGTTHTLQLLAFPSIAGSYDLHLHGRLLKADPRSTGANPEGQAIERDIELFLQELGTAPLGGLNDGILHYQLSYVQADRAVAALRTLGYTVIEYKKSGGDNPTATVFDNLFEPVPATGSGGSLRRPVVIKLVDSESTSLVQGPTDTDADAELDGGQPLDGVTDAAPQQRLLIVFDKNDRASLDELLATLQRNIDVAAKQILIEALVIELDHDRLLELGVDLKGRKDGVDFSFEQQTGGLVQPLVFTFNTPSPRTLLELTTRLRALVDRGEATVLSRPSVFVLDGRQARIKVGDNIPFTSKLTLGVGGVITSETDFLKTGIILNLRPRAASDNSEVSLQVEAIISSPGPTRILPDVGTLLAPTLQSRQIQTLVKVANDTPFVIGGLIAHNDQRATVGIPGLSRIPLIGSLFRKDSVSADRKEVIIVITPHIVPASDPTFAYTIPRDAANAHAGHSELRGEPRGPHRSAGLCPSLPVDPDFEPIRPEAFLDAVSIFDSFNTELFRNVYRLRAADIFDLEFITEDSTVRSAVERVQLLARELTAASFPGRPRVDPVELENEVRWRLQELCKAQGGSDALGCLDLDQERTFLTLYEGGVPGEEILVHNMLIRILERFSFSDCIDLDRLIFFRVADDPGPLLQDPYARECVGSGKTLIVGFVNENTALGDFAKSCAGEDARRQEARVPSDEFATPRAQLACVQLADDEFIDKLRDCNSVAPNGTWRWHSILLNQQFKQRRSRNPIALLQSVLALERLLELNDSNTFPRTLSAFHVGRELVFPTAEDLQEQTHLIDPGTARLFYETLDYYRAFSDSHKRKTEYFKGEQSRLENFYFGQASADTKD